MPRQNNYQLFKTDSESVFNAHIRFLIEGSIGFHAYTSGEYYIIEYTGGY